jgi:hypothetical protein
LTALKNGDLSEDGITKMIEFVNAIKPMFKSAIAIVLKSSKILFYKRAIGIFVFRGANL